MEGQAAQPPLRARGASFLIIGATVVVVVAGRGRGSGPCTSKNLSVLSLLIASCFGSKIQARDTRKRKK